MYIISKIKVYTTKEHNTSQSAEQQKFSHTDDWNTKWCSQVERVSISYKTKNALYYCEIKFTTYGKTR